jgi:uncharacterized membrane protein
VIYPLAFAYRANDIVFHGAPLTGTDRHLAKAFERDPGTFYLVGRLWSMLFGIGAIPLIFLIGRRVFGELVGVLGAAFWAVVPLAVQYGRTTRSDSAALFFAMLTIWLCIVAFEQPSTRGFLLAGSAAGLGVSSRYLMVVLAPVIVAIWWLARPVDQSRRRGVMAARLVAGLGALVVTFALTTPYVLLDWRGAVRSIRAEAVDPVLPHHSIVANLQFYVWRALPGALPPPVLIAALVGVWLVLRRRQAIQLVLVGYVTVFIVEISALSLHWQRWTIPALPIVVLIAADVVVTAATWLAGRVRTRHQRFGVIGATACGLLLVTASPASAVLRLDQRDSGPSTLLAARAWIARKHLAVEPHRD